MPTQTPTTPASPRLDVAGVAMPGSAAERIQGLRCRNCGKVEAIGPSYVCGACFGPLEVVYDYAVIRDQIDRATIERRPPGIWRYLELLPVNEPPARGLAIRTTPRGRKGRCSTGPPIGFPATSGRG